MPSKKEILDEYFARMKRNNEAALRGLRTARKLFVSELKRKFGKGKSK